AEARNFESLWVPEHTHIPTSRRSPFAGGQQLPEQYKHTLDPYVALTAAAAATKTLRVGTGICLIIERDTITTAKSVASLDLLSHGRFEFGLGGGWNAEEMEHHGTEFKSRFKRLEEQVRALKEIWTRDVAEFHGQFVNFDPIWAWPKPEQKPYPPILLGGGGKAGEMDHDGTKFKSRFKRLEEQVRARKEIWTGNAAEFHGQFVNYDPIGAWPKPEQKPYPPILLGGESGYTLQRVVDFCDGWYPRGRAPEKVLEGLKDLKARAAKAG